MALISKSFTSSPLFLLLSLLTFQVDGRNIDWTAVDLLMEEFRVVNEIPGVALALVDSDSVTSKGYGLSDLEVGRQMDNSTRLLIASISKSFTALVTCRALQEKFPELGERVLDVPVKELIPSYPLVLIDRYRTEKVTFRDLLSHRTCLNSYGIGVTAGAYASRDDRLYRYRYIGEKCGFRSGFEYSNAMFILAGDIIGHLMNRPFDDMVKDFLQELGMSDSLIVGPTEDYEILPGMSRGYFRDLDLELKKMNASVYNSHSGAAAGGIISSSNDMGNYIRFHLNQGAVNGTQVVPKEVMEWVYQPANRVPFKVEPGQSNVVVQGDFAYGLGLDLGLYGSWSRVAHEGDLSPFTSRLTFYPQQGLGFFTVINGPGPLPKPTDQRNLHNRLTQLVLEGRTKPNKAHQLPVLATRPNANPTKNQSIPSSFAAKVTPLVPPEDYVGLYGHPYEGDISISLGPNGSLHLQYGIWGKGLLLPVTETLFEIQWEGDIVSIFLAYSGGPPLPTIQWEFGPDSLTYIDSDGGITYLKNRTIETYPEIPWSPDSCFVREPEEHFKSKVAPSPFPSLV